MKRFLKITLCALLAAAMLFSFAGCSSVPLLKGGYFLNMLHLCTLCNFNICFHCSSSTNKDLWSPCGSQILIEVRSNSEEVRSEGETLALVPLRSIPFGAAFAAR